MIISRATRWADHVALMGRMENAYILDGNLEENRPLEVPGIRCEDVDRIHVVSR
jgi:hypothetical protein